jgi:tetratricopeptide (TPR) repeat protein
LHHVTAAPVDALFRFGTNSFNAGEYVQAAGAFAQAASLHASGGTLQNLGLSEWQSGRPGPAILAWEQALWIDPLNQVARNNLRFARRAAQLETPDLTWAEVVSSWLPANWWAWVASVSLWAAVGVSTVPGLMRWPKASWHQAVSAVGLAVFLLSIPAHIGVNSRAKLGFVLFKDTPLRLTPTEEAQTVTHLAAGEPGRVERVRGRYLLIRASHTEGWVLNDQFRLICSPPTFIPKKIETTSSQESRP